MSISKNALIAAVSKETQSDKDLVRLHVDMFLAGIGRELAMSKRVKIKQFGTLSMTDDGVVAFEAAPALVRNATMEEVIDDISHDIAEDLAERMRSSAERSTQVALSADIGIPTSELIQSLKGGNGPQGTWVHPKVSIHLE
jgi:hypothetical protein